MVQFLDNTNQKVTKQKEKNMFYIEKKSFARIKNILIDATPGLLW